MVNAFTFDDGTPRSFRTRKDMYDWMIENGHSVVEGVDASVFEKHISTTKHPKAKESMERLVALRGY